MNETPRPTGLELRLAGVPYGMSESALKKRLAKLLKIKYDFLVLFESYSEELFWEAFSKHDITNTARIIIPDTDSSNIVNPGTVLIHRREFTVFYKGTEYILTVTDSRSSEMTNEKYDELRDTDLVLKRAVKAVRDGPLGDIREVSCGAFDHNNKFETAHIWSAEHRRDFNKFAYFGDAWPRKFHICLTESDPGEPLKWEWMDIHESTIRGIIFEEPKDQSHRVLYFVVDKPPQFYQRTEDAPPQAISSRASADTSGPFKPRLGIIQAGNSGDIYIHSRVSHPSITSKPARESHDVYDVANVPWIIQYSRVFRVEYEVRKNFSLISYEPRLSQTQKETLISFHHPGIKQSERTLDDIVLTLNQNMSNLRKLLPQRSPDCSLAVLKLFYNCNVCPFLDEATSVIKCLFGLLRGTHDIGVFGHAAFRRRICEGLKISSLDMETGHLRTLRRLHALLPKGCPKIPQRVIRHPIEAEDALEKEFQNFEVESIESWIYAPPEVFDVMVYPSHIELHGPLACSLNSIIEKYQDTIDRFIRVKFLDNSGKPLRMEPGINPDYIIENRVVRVLQNETQLFLPANQRFEFLGYSVSGLKKRKAVWFLRNDHNDLTTKKIRDQIGKWDANDDLAKALAKMPSKWGARVALAFTESLPAIRLLQHEWTWRKDEGENRKFSNTDGCGIISPELCDALNEKLAPLGFKRSGAFQIRFGGAKGVVYSGAESLLKLPDVPEGNLKMLLRESQIKFNAPSLGRLTLRIVSTTGDEICRVSDDKSNSGSNARHVLLKLAARLKRHEIFAEHYAKSFLKLYLAMLAERARDRKLFEIPIPGSCQALGLTDDYQILERKEVYIRARGKTVTGPVLIYRDPIIHIGDIQEARGLTDNQAAERLQGMRHRYPNHLDHFAALTRMDNVIFFSQKDNPPFPNLLSGGDLDGDRFEILTKACGFWGDEYRTSEPDNYFGEPSAENKPEMNDFDVKELAKFIGEYIRNDCFSELQDILMCLADRREQGMKDDDVKDLAKWLSQAVDYAKSGVKVDLYENVVKKDKFKIRAKPDFLRALDRRAFYDSKGEYYQSSKLLGRIYRRISSLRYAIPKTTDNSALQDALAIHWRFEPINHPGFRTRQEDTERIGISAIVQREFNDYRNYLEVQNVPQHSEIDIFLRKQPDDFPDSQIESLSRSILELLSVSGRVTRVGPTSSEPVRFCVVDIHSQEVVEQIYRRFLFLAWEMSLRLANVKSTDYSAGFGQSYAFLCLYAVYFHELPVEVVSSTTLRMLTSGLWQYTLGDDD